MIRRRHHNNQEQRSGAALVESALVLPIFFLVTLSVVEFGRAFMVSQLLTNSAREGARLAITAGVTNQEVVDSVTDQVASTVGVSAAQVTVDITITPFTGNPDPGNDLTQANKRDLCNVTTSVLYDDVSFVPMRFLAGVSLAGQAAMRHE